MDLQDLWYLIVNSVGADPKSGSKGGYDASGTSSTVPSTPRTEGEILQSSNLKSFSFGELKAATRNFRPDSVLGEGGFGCVYKGWIDEHSLTPARPGTGMVIAVKRLNQESFQGHQEWLVSIPLFDSPCCLFLELSLGTANYLNLLLIITFHKASVALENAF